MFHKALPAVGEISVNKRRVRASPASEDLAACADLESKFCSELPDARTADGICDDAEIDCVLQVAVRGLKVHPIENVE